MKPIIIGIVGILALLFFVGGAFLIFFEMNLLEYSEKFEQNYLVENATSLSVENFNGNIKITTWNESFIKVYAEKRTKYGKDEADKISIVITTEGNNIIVKSEEVSPILFSPRVSVMYDIKIPPTLNLNEIKTINGNIEIAKCRGNTSLESLNGNIKVYTHDGNIKAKTLNGNIEIKEVKEISNVETLNGIIKVDVHSIKEASEITSKNGAIYAYISRNLNLNIESSTLNGNIEIRNLTLTPLSLSSTHLKGRIGNGGDHLLIKTLNGNIYLIGIN